MKKILFLHPELVVGGAEKVLLNLLKELDRTKFEVTLVLRNKAVWDNQIPKDIKTYYLFDKNPRRSGPLLSRLYKYTMIFFPWIIWKLFGVKGTFDIAVAFHEPMLWYLPCMNSKRVTWVHTDYAALPYPPEIKELANKDGCLAKQILRLRRKVINKCDYAVFVAKSAVYGYVSYNSFPKSKTVVCYNLNGEEDILKLAKEDIKVETWNNYNGVKLLSVGRIADQKAMHRLLPMMKHIKEQGIDAKLYIVGDGPLRKELQEQIDNDSLHDDIIILGFDQNPYKYIADAKLLICSSVYEAYCTVTKESILLETPFVTTLCSGMEEQVGGTNAGVIVENDEDTLYVPVIQILLDANRYTLMKEDIRKRHKELSDKTSLEGIESFLDCV